MHQKCRRGTTLVVLLHATTEGQVQIQAGNGPSAKEHTGAKGAKKPKIK